MKNYTITVNGNVYLVTVEEGFTAAASAPVAAPAPVAAAPVAAAPAPAAAPAVTGGVAVESPMPGKILSIKASVGQAVKKGQVILVLEAMKMENEIVAPQDGVISAINVSAGDSVEPGAVLATIGGTAAPAPVAAPAPAAGGITVESPMPGKILGVKASVGQAVKKGQVIVILEAMKMENEIVAPQDGVIATINVNTGDSVEPGATLATLN